MKGQELRSLKRGLQALAVINQRGVASISELARELDLPRTTAERIVTTLAAEGYVTRFEDDKRYGLSLKIFALAHGMSNETWITNIAEGYLSHFTEEHGWPLAIATPLGTNMVMRSTTYPATSLWLTQRRLGSEEPIAASSGGMAYLAHTAPGEHKHLIDMMHAENRIEMQRLGQARGIEFILNRVRLDGYAFEPNPEQKEDSIAVPIMVNGSVRGSLMMIYMTRAMRRAAVIADYAGKLQTLARQIADHIDRAQIDIASHPGRIEQTGAAAVERVAMA